MAEKVGTYPNRCGLCDGPPRWRLDRHGDARVTWACWDHFLHVLTDLLPGDEHRDAATVTDLANVWRPIHIPPGPPDPETPRGGR